MYNKALLLLAFIALGECHDLSIGSKGSLIYNQTVQASPALWRQNNNVTVTANNSEIISKIVVTDLREEKDGDIKIVEGGEGQNNVTFELKSPTVLRGYEFHIEVYAVPSDALVNEGSTVNSNDRSTKDATTGHPSEAMAPSVLGKDDNIRSARTMKDGQPISLNIPKGLKDETTTENTDTNSSTSMPDNEAQDKDLKKEKDDAQNHEIVDFVLNMDDQSEKSALRSENLKTEDVSTEMASETTTTEVTEVTTNLDEMTASTSSYENDDIENVDDLNVPAIITKMVPPKDNQFSNEWNRQHSELEHPRTHHLRNQNI